VSGLPELAGKVAVVTGGASGIGKGIASQLRVAGMEVVLADVEKGALDAAAAELGAHGIEVDVSDFASVERLAGEVVERFGAVHVVCNNAGIGPAAPIADLTIDDWRWIVGVNLWGVIHGVTAFLPLLEANQDGGHIVNTASLAGLRVAPGLGSYSVTKFGIVALTETLAVELEAKASRVGVTVLCPGTVRTNIKTSSRNRPANLARGGLTDVDLESDPRWHRPHWLEPEEVGAIVVRAIEQGDLYAFTHPEMFAAVEERHRAIEAAARRQ
jgi:NAD(P)-dependent dehydrogenase (short-subunit alcohol dehydrogenase family)